MWESELHIEFLWENWKRRDNIECHAVRIILKLIIKQQGVVVWTGFIRIRIESSGGLTLSGSPYIIWQFVVFLVLLQCYPDDHKFN